MQFSSCVSSLSFPYYNDTFSPTPGITATRTIISIATAEDLELHSVDFTQAFIQAEVRTRYPMALSKKPLNAFVVIPRWIGLLRVTHTVEMAIFYVFNDFE